MTQVKEPGKRTKSAIQSKPHAVPAFTPTERAD